MAWCLIKDSEDVCFWFCWQFCRKHTILWKVLCFPVMHSMKYANWLPDVKMLELLNSIFVYILIAYSTSSLDIWLKSGDVCLLHWITLEVSLALLSNVKGYVAGLRCVSELQAENIGPCVIHLHYCEAESSNQVLQNFCWYRNRAESG